VNRSAAKPRLLSVAEALAAVLANASEPLPTESVPLGEAAGRFLAEPLVALRSQPPFPASAMDGYAVRAADVARAPVTLKLIGMAAAGHGFAGEVGPGEAVRIFTGAPVPQGADAIVIQEDAQAVGESVEIRESVAVGRYVRRAGLDFRQGEQLVAAGRRIDARLVGLAAATGHAKLAVRRRPRVGILATGDELVRPGLPVGPDQIVVSNTYSVATLAADAGAKPADLGIARDNPEELEQAIRGAMSHGLDVLVTIGGASVGDHDLVRAALAQEGMELGFWRIAMRPGKPLMHGRIGDMLILGLPGNPVSSYVCGLLFLLPLLRALQGDPQAGMDPSEPAILGAPLAANDARQDYLRATLARRDDGALVATPFPLQDSSMTRTLATSDALIVRAPHAAAAEAGARCRVVRL
jgi:molybdopterin molybdotransferase